MATSKYLAFDFGAESGRAIVGILDGGKISIEEIHRFKNKQINVFHNYYWNIFELFEELKTGLKIAVRMGHGDIQSMGVDTWGVDFGLIGEDGQLLELPHSYRDPRTEGMMEKVFEIIPRDKIYEKTGIQFMELNSLYQLYSMKKMNDKLLKSAKRLLFMPDLFNYFLTGKMKSEYTIASTSQLMNVNTKQFEKKIFSKLGLPYDIMAPIIQPGEIIGKLLKKNSEETGIGDADVVAVGCHDTASAVAAVPAEGENWAYLSSGTWSLIGIESDKPIINKNYEDDFTNEGGIGNKIRFLRNTMGMWLIQRLRSAWERDGACFDYVDIANIASKAEQFKCFINPDARIFMNPSNMEEAIDEFCKRTNQECPKDKFGYARTIYESLALKYKLIIKMIEEVSGKKIEKLHVVSGGAQNEFLNQLTADATGIPVLAGPIEATALGSILVQAIAAKKIESIEHAREIVRRSFDIRIYNPTKTEKWDEMLEKYKSIIA